MVMGGDKMSVYYGDPMALQSRVRRFTDLKVSGPPAIISWEVSDDYGYILVMKPPGSRTHGWVAKSVLT